MRAIALRGVAIASIVLVVASCSRTPGSGRELVISLAVFPGEAERYRSFLRDFEAQNHLRVEIIAQTYGDILQAIGVQARAGSGSIDVGELDLAMLGEAHENVTPLDAIVPLSASPLFPQTAWKAGRFDGHLDFVPHRLMWQAMIYNRIFVPHPPATWDELAQFAREHPGKLALKGARYEGAICDAMAFVWAAGGTMCEPFAPGSFRALAFLGGLARDLDPESAVFREMSVLDAQARGEIWIHFNWPFAMGYLASKGLAPSPNLSAPIPAGPSGLATPLGGGYLAIPRFAPHPDLARALIAYLMTAAAQRRLADELGWYGSVELPPGSEPARLYSGFAEMRPYVRARPTIDCYARLSNRWQRAVRAVLFRDGEPAGALAGIGTGATNPASAATGGGACSCAESSP
jgi:ABC-type glycerol-3-phosphate transport system substrate-binding protein